MQSQKSPKPAVDSIIPYFNHPFVIMSGHDFFDFFFDLFLISEAAILKMAAILEKPKVANTPPHDALFLCQVWLRSVKRSFREAMDILRVRRRRKRKKIITSNTVIGCNHKSRPNRPWIVLLPILAIPACQ